MEEDFHPQSLESLLGEEVEEEEDVEEVEEKEVQQTPGEVTRSSYILYPATNREFDVEGVTDARGSLTRLEVKGQESEPAWSTQLSTDSACSEGSAGSLEQQHDADTDSLSQGSSVGSLCLEDDEDRNSLKSHFDTLASSLSDEKFDTDPRTLQPPEEKHFLNPRLSISTRFLTRFQDRIRAWPGRAPPPASVPTRISEESSVNTSVNSESSGEVTSAESTHRENNNNNSGVRCSSVLRHRPSFMTSNSPLRCKARRRHTVVVVQCRETLREAVQQGSPRLGYLGTTASSRAKLSQDTPNASTQEENLSSSSSSSDLQPPAPLLSAGLDLQGPKADPDEDRTSVAHSSLKSLQPRASHQEPALGRVGRWSVSSAEETLTNQNQTFEQSPAPSITPTATPTVCDLISCFGSSQDAGPGSDLSSGAELSSDPPTSSSSPLSETLRLPQAGSGGVEEAVTLLQCQQVANELRQTARRAAHLYQQLGESVTCSQRRRQMTSVLREAFAVVNAELQAARGESGDPSGPPQDDRTMVLLERYSEQLVQMTQNKLNRI